MFKDRTFLKKNWEKYQLYYLAFIVPFFAMLVIFIGNRIYPFGDRSFLHVDMYHQYFPFLVEFYHKLKEGEALSYCWNAGIGSNFIALFAYYLASPLNYLCILIPESFLMEFMSYLVVVKAGLCGLTAAIYLSKHFETKKLSVVLFSTFYAMSGYMAAYNWNVMWLDCVVLAPLIILGLEKLVKEGKYRLYCISLGLAILSNYYICIMICAYLVFYFFVVLFPFAEKKGKAFVRFSAASLLAGGLGSLYLIPEAFAMQLSKFSTATFPKDIKMYFSLFDMLARHFMDVEVEIGLDHWPNLYCSVAVLFFVPLYIFSKKISAKKKFFNGLLLIFLLISFSNNALNFLWHGYNYPDSLPCRQSFLYVLLVITICYEAFLHLKEFSKQEFTLVCSIALIFLLLCQKLITDEAITDLTYLLSLVFIILYGVLLYFFVTDVKFKSYLIWAALFVVFVESGCNMILTSVPTVSRPNYMKNYDLYEDMWELQSEQDTDSFYRYDKKNRVTNNDSMLHDYPSVSMFSSTTNGLVNHFYSRFGMRTSKVFYCSDGMTPFMSALLSVGYTFGDDSLIGNPLYSCRQQQEDVYLYQNKYALPLGFCIYPEDNMLDFLVEEKAKAFAVIEEGKKDDLLPIPNQNQLGKRLGAEDNIFTEIQTESSSQGSSFTVPENGNVYVYLNKGLKEVVAHADGVELATYKKLSNRYVLDLGYHNAGTEILLTAEEESELNAYSYLLNEAVLAELLEQLNQHSLKIETMESDYLKGKITSDKEGYLILSIPYDPGFQVLVDGEVTEVKLFEEMMMAVPVKKGTQRIELFYTVKGRNLGILISMGSVLLLVALILLQKKKRMKKEKQNISLEE